MSMLFSRCSKHSNCFTQRNSAVFVAATSS